ncbi:hypothetical protein CsatB_009872 [Cannabis sativa]
MAKLNSEAFWVLLWLKYVYWTQIRCFGEFHEIWGRIEIGIKFWVFFCRKMVHCFSRNGEPFSKTEPHKIVHRLGFRFTRFFKF